MGMASFVSSGLNTDEWLDQAKEVFYEKIVQKNYTPSLKSAFKEFTKCYKELTISW